VVSGGLVGGILLTISAGAEVKKLLRYFKAVLP
jgi:hypothetical protein